MTADAPAPQAESDTVPVFDSARRPHPFLEEILELSNYRELVTQWSRRTIKLRYKRSALGVVWTLLEPLMLMTILTVVFSTMFGDRLPRYPVYILIGLMSFDFFNRSTTSMIDEILSSQGLARKIYVPRSAFAVASILTYLTNWFLAWIPLLGVILILGHPVNLSLLTALPAVALLAAFALGVGLIVATFSAFFHDIIITYRVLLTGWLYATPVIYPIEIVPERFRPIILANPMTHLVRLLQEPVYHARVAPLETWLIGAAVSFGALAIGWWTFTHWRDAFDYRA
jgi:ABC-2 type transport system permease protein